MTLNFLNIEFVDGIAPENPSTHPYCPQFKTEGAAGADCVAAISETVVIKPGERALIPLGFKLALPKGFAALLLPRSGLALGEGVTVANSPGLIDSDYRGEVKAVIINHGESEFLVRPIDRIAQICIISVPYVMGFKNAKMTDFETDRGEGGFGSTGV